MKKSNDLFEQVKRSRTFTNLRERFDLAHKKVLDIGCSEGHYLQLFGAGSLGVTIIPEHVEDGKKRGLNIKVANVEDPAFSVPDVYDVVWANNLFEHMNAPHPFLHRMRDVLAPDGFLILGVPIIPIIPFLTRLKKFRGAFAVSHVNFFSRRTLVETVRAAGWDVKEARLFFFKNPLLDLPFTLIAPHLYVVATRKKDFSYAEKRLRSLEGY